MKKTKDSWFFFALYSITYLMIVLNSGSLLADALQLEKLWHKTAITAVLILCSGILFSCLRAFGLKLAVRRARKSSYPRKTSFFLMEIMPASLLYAASVCTRIWYAWHISLGAGGNLLNQAENIDFYKNPNGVLWIYGQLTDRLVWLLGNYEISVYVLNAVLQLLVIVAGYLFLRMTVHRNAGIAYAVLWNVFPYTYELLQSATPDLLYMLVLLSLLCFILPVCRKCSLKEQRSAVNRAVLILLGVLNGLFLIGHVLYFLTGITVFVLLAVYSRRKKTDLLSYGIGYAAGILGAISAGGILFACSMDIDGILQGINTYATHYFRCFILPGKLQVHDFWIPDLLIADTYVYYKIAMCALSGGLLFLFYKNEQECERVFGLICAGSMIYALSGSNALYSSDVMILEMVVLMTAVSVGMIFTLKNPLEKKLRVETDETDETDEEAKDDANEESPAVKLIENPLPLPKKHVRKELDYAYEVKAEDMKYDVPVNDTDDFDLP